MIGNDVGRLWFELERREEALAQGKRNGWAAVTNSRLYDSMGRTLDAGAREHWGSWKSKMSRVQRVRAALRDSQDGAIQLLRQQLTGLDVSAIAATLVDAAQDVALIYGSSAVAGAFIGGAGGALIGGMGAVPGAAIGAATGIKAGTAILAFLGLKSLIEDLGGAIPQALQEYERGFDEAWGPLPRSLSDSMHWQRSQGDVHAAASCFARGHALLVMAVLSALAAYLLRGAGNKALALRDIRASSRLGPKVAAWVEQHADDLARHPRLQPRQRAGAGGDSPPPPPPQRPRRGDEEPGRRPMPTHRVRCFSSDNLPRNKVPEFERQLAGQQTGLNDLTVDEYLQGREAFQARDPAVARAARAEYEQKLTRDLSLDLQSSGIARKSANVEAALQAAEKMKALAALHNPDLFSGGKDVIADFGDRQVNSSIGPQWRSRIDTLDQAALNIPESQRAATHMNARLSRCP
jgi:hypothetical protein